MYDLYPILGNPKNVFSFITWIFAVGMIISSFEYLVIIKEFKSTGIFSWNILSSKPNYLNFIIPRKYLDFIFEYKAVFILQCLRIFTCILLPVIEVNTIRVILLITLSGLSLIFSFRNIVGVDGADQMNSIILITMSLVYAFNDPSIFKIGIIFIASQILLSYFVAGLSKLLSTKWRNGSAVFGIMNTKTYGQKTLAKVLLFSPKYVNYLLCWGIIIFELSFILIIIVPFPYFVFLLGLGIIFHIYNALIMGLNNFLWAFIAAYPSLAYLNILINS